MLYESSTSFTLLTELETLGVSLVREGANKKRFALAKSTGAEMIDPFSEIVKAVMDVEATDAEARLEDMYKNKDISKRALKVMQSMLRLADGFQDELPDDFVPKLAQLMGMESDRKDEMEEEDEDEDDKDDVEMSKSAFSNLTDAQKLKLESLWKERDEAVKKADALERKDFIAKTAQEFANYPAKHQDIAELLLDVKKHDDKLYQRVHDVLKSADNVIKSGKAFAEIGSSRNAGEQSDAWSVIENKANEFVAKSANKLSFAQAMDAVIKANPELYDNYVNESSRAR